MKRVYPTTIQSGASQTGNYLLTLLEPEGGTQVPIIVGQSEAQSILLAKEGVATRRPMIHEVVMNILDTYGLELRRVTIDRVVEGVFYATLHLSDGFNEKQIDSRSSDAITLALYHDTPILMDESVLEETGVKAEKSEMKIEDLEKELQRCEEAEDYERAAEIQKQIERLRLRNEN